MEKAKIFETTLKDYLAQISRIDISSRADALGGAASGGALIIPFYGRPHRVSNKGVTDAFGHKANFAVSVVLCCYILQCPRSEPVVGEWVTYREFRDAAPLTGYFATNTNKIIETTFAGQIDTLKAAIGHAGGRLAEGPTFDLAAHFDMLPRIPVYFRFNDRDDEFPAQSSILFRESAETYLDMESLAIGGTFLTGLLINAITGKNGIER